MTIYYLMVKTHINTGLKYLCQTKRKDPHTYLGSGDYWKPHLTKHGKEITTEILRECQSKEELREWGLYYSNLWDVVNARNETGKKIWANLVPESGNGGHGFSGSKGKTYEELYGADHAAKLREKRSIAWTNRVVTEHTKQIQSLNRKGKRCAGDNTNAKQFLFNGVLYSTIDEAILVSGLSRYKFNKIFRGVQDKPRKRRV